MADLLSMLYGNYDPESMAAQMMQQRAAQQPDVSGPAPVNLRGGNSGMGDSLSPIVRASLPVQSSSVYQPTSGSQMEADSRSSIDGLMNKMEALRNQYRQQDQNQQWMSFFAKLASSKSPTFLGGLGEGAQALSDTTAKQAANNQLLDQSALQDQIKYQEWNRDQARQEAAQKSTEAYQKGELGLKQQTVGPDNALKAAQAKYYEQGAGAGNRVVSVIGEDGKPVLMPARDAMAQGFSPTAGYAANAVTLSPEAVKQFSDLIATTGKIPQGLGVGMTGNKGAILNQLAIDHPQADLGAIQAAFTGELAGARTVGNTSGKIEFVSESLGSMIPLAKKASAEVDRTQYPTINAIKNAVNQGSGDTKIIALNSYLNAIMADQAALFTRGGDSTDTARAKAEKAANAAYSDGQLNTYFDSINNEIKAQRAAGKSAMSNVISLGKKDSQQITAAGSNGASDPAIAIQHAKEAITAGAPRDEVIKRLKSMNISTDGL